MKRPHERTYIAKINGNYFAGLSKTKVYAGSCSQHAFHCLVNICAKPDGMAAFEFTVDVKKAAKMSFFEVSHNFMQMLNDRTRYEYLPPVKNLEIIEA